MTTDDAIIDDFSSLFRAERASLVNYTRAVVAQDLRLAEDLTQEAFTVLFHKWPTEAWTTRQCRAFLRATVNNMGKKHWERAANLKRKIQMLRPSLSGIHHDEYGTYDRVYEALSELPPKQRQVFYLRYEGFTFSEISQILNMNTATARSNYNHAKTTLKVRLGASLDEESAEDFGIDWTDEATS